MPTSYTPHLHLAKPQVNGEDTENSWGYDINANFDKVDDYLTSGLVLDEAPDDDRIYGRHNNNWILIPEAGESIVEAPRDGQIYARNGETYTWVPFDPDPPPPTWAEVTDKPTNFPAAPHTHAQADIINLTADLGAKAPVVHGHAMADITGLPAAFDAKAPVVHTHTIDDVLGLRTDLSDKVAKAGDTLTGFLTLHAAPTADLHAASKQYVDGRTVDAPSDGGEYVRVNGVWRLKERTYDLGTKASQDIVVPDNTKSCQIIANIWPPAALAYVGLAVSTDGTTFKTGAADYNEAAPYHDSGTAAFSSYGPANTPNIALCYTADVATTPIHITADVGLVRPNNTSYFNVKSYGKSFKTSADARYRTYWGYGVLNLTAAGEALRLQALRLLITAGVCGSGSFATVRWIY